MRHCRCYSDKYVPASLTIAYNIEQREKRSESILRFATKLSGTSRKDLLHDVVTGGDPVARVIALAELAVYAGSSEKQKSSAYEFLDQARARTSIPNAILRARALGALIRYLPSIERRAVFQQAVDVAAAVGIDARREIALAIQMPNWTMSEVRFAIDSSMEMGHTVFATDVPYRCEPFWELIPEVEQLPLRDRAEAVQYALYKARDIGVPSHRSAALGALVPFLPSAIQTMVLREAVEQKSNYWTEWDNEDIAFLMSRAIYLSNEDRRIFVQEIFERMRDELGNVPANKSAIGLTIQLDGRDKVKAIIPNVINQNP